MKPQLVSKTMLDVVNEANETVYYKSRFCFINCHRGFRPGAMHLFIGIAGGGKSTLARTLLIDVLQTGKGVFLWLSEDDPLKYLAAIHKSGFDMDLKQITWYSEQDARPDKLLEMIEYRIKEKNIKFLFLDNLTTSLWYGLDTKQQAESALKLKELCKKTGITLILFAHTDSKINEGFDGMVENNFIRGNKTIVNLVEFTYIMQRFTCEGIIYPTVRVTKYRDQNPEERIYKLNFYKKARIYVEDEPLSFTEFRTIFNKRDRLSGSDKCKDVGAKNSKTSNASSARQDWLSKD